MTYDEYINNPMGNKNAVISNREMYRRDYTERLNIILVRERGFIDYRTYQDKKNEKYYCYAKIPSEKVPDVYYDVVVEFSKPKSTKGLDNTLTKWDVRFFSNDPAFVFTFCHAFIKNKMFIEEYSARMSKEAIKHRAVEKNPKDIVGYVKSLYFLYLIMKKRGLFNKSLYTEEYDEKTLLQTIVHSDVKLEERQHKERLKAQKKRKQKNIRNMQIMQYIDDKPDTTSHRIKKTRVTNVVKSTGHIKTTKPTNELITKTKRSKRVNTVKRNNKT